MTSYGEVDPQNVYLVKFSGRGAVDQTLSMTWNETGLLSTAGAAVTNRSIDVAVSGVKLLASVGTKAAFGAAFLPVDPRNKAERCKVQSPNDEWVLSILAKDGADASGSLKNTYCEIDAAKRGQLPHETADRALFEDATKDYAAKVLPLVEARTDILNGTSMSLEPATLLPRIESEIGQQLATLYLGSKVVKTWEGTVDVREIDVANPTTVMAIDEDKGFCLRDSVQAWESKAVPDEIKSLGVSECAAVTNPIALRFEYFPVKAGQLHSMVFDEPSGDRSFRYRIPAQVVAHLVGKDDKGYGDAVLSIAQLGTVISLPAQRHTKSLSYDLAFLEATGALKSFKLGTTGSLDAATVESLSTAGGAYLDARSAKRKSEEELAVLTEQDTILKLKDEICTIQAKYGITCSVAPK
jgi:hypothetical protein